MKPFNRTLSLNIDALHVRIDYIKRMPQTPATKRRLEKLTDKLRKLQRRIPVR